MAYSYTWPATLPQAPLYSGFSAKNGANFVRTPQDKGPAKVRRRGFSPEQVQCQFLMTDAQLATFETFYRDTIKGVARFGFTHPKTGEVVECRIAPSDQGGYSITPNTPGRWFVTMTMEVLP